MKAFFRLLFILISAALLIYAITELAIEERQEKIEKRAKQMPKKDCYTWQEVEMIVHGEIQE